MIGSKLLKAGLIIFLCMHIVSMTYGFLPEEMLGAPMTFRGFMHYVITGIIVPLTILTRILIGVGVRKTQGFRRFSVYSTVTGIIISGMLYSRFKCSFVWVNPQKRFREAYGCDVIDWIVGE